MTNKRAREKTGTIQDMLVHVRRSKRQAPNVTSQLGVETVSVTNKYKKSCENRRYNFGEGNISTTKTAALKIQASQPTLLEETIIPTIELQNEINPQMSEKLICATKELSQKLEGLTFKSPVQFVYNVYEYANEPHQMYFRKHANAKKKVLFVGMNPGPFGMAQTGVPFGDIKWVRDWVGISGDVRKPKNGEHPKRPIVGYTFGRGEVSGQRFWGMASKACGEGPNGAARFFNQCFVYNYCPLVFMGSTGANITPEKLKGDERSAVLDACDATLRQIVQTLEIEYIIGVGKFATERARKIVSDCPSVKIIESILHPSPASPLANKGWSDGVLAKLSSIGIVL